MKKVLCALIITITSLSTQLVAQEQSDTLSFSLLDAIDYAMQNAYQKINADHDVEIARKKIWETTAIGLPQVSASTGYNYHIQQMETPLPADFMPADQLPEGVKPGDKIYVSFGSKHDANVGIAVNQLIFDGSYIIGLKASKVYLRISEEAREKTQIEIRKMVFQAYYLALTALNNVETFTKSLEISEQLYKETNAYYENGFREKLDVSQVELMVSNGKSRLMEAERAYKVALATLKYAMGLNLDQNIYLKDKMDDMITTAHVISTGSPDFSVENYIDYKIAFTNSESQKLLWQNEKVQFLPKIYAFYNYNSSGYNDEWSAYNDLRPSQLVGFSLNLPIFTSGMRLSKVKQSKLQYIKSQNDLTAASEDIKREYLTASTNLSSAKEQYDNALKNKDLANEIYQMTLTKFNNGLANSTLLAQNEAQYLQAETSYIQSALNMLNAHIEYQKIIGKL